MNPRTRSICRAGMPLALLVLVLPSSGTARADIRYQIQPIVRSGERAGDLPLRPGSGFEVGTLNDRGQLVFLARMAAGGQMLLQYGDGTFTPIAVAGQEGPLGKWPGGLGAFTPVSMNQSGSIVFSPGTSATNILGTFLWDVKAKQVRPVALSGMPAGTDLTFTPGGGSVPVVNNHGDIAFVAPVQNAAGPVGEGLFFLAGMGEGRVLTVAVPGQALPEGGALQRVQLPSLSDAGVVAFLARPQGGPYSAYRWENGTVMPVALTGTDVPGAGKIALVRGVRVNNKNSNLLVAARLDGSSDDGLYRWADGKLAPAAVPGQEMPGGGRLKTVPVNYVSEQGPAVSYANERGEHAFLATLDDGATAAYLLDAEGKLSLILKSDTTTDLGTITHVGGRGSIGLGLNGRGQVALAINIAGGPETLVLLTPTAP